MEENTVIKTYNAIYSVKGGCGKTAFAIQLAHYLTVNELTEKETGEAKVCLIDTDILGSSMLNTFTPIYGESTIPDFLKEQKYINHIVDMEKICDYTNFFINSKVIEKQMRKDENEDEAIKLGEGFDIVFASPKASDINKYRINGSNEFVPVIQHNIFRASFSRFINNKMAFKNVKDIVFDLPPSADGFSNTVFDCIFGKDSKRDKIGTKKDIRNLFFVMNLDSGHILSVIREWENLIMETEMVFPNNIFIVINDTSNYTDFMSVAEKRMGILAQKIREIGKFKENEYNSIYFIWMGYNEKYIECVINGEGLAKNKLESIVDFDRVSVYDINGKNLTGQNLLIKTDGDKKNRTDVLFNLIRKQRGDK